MSESTVLAPFACPRCHQQVEERFYGPCEHCREELATSLHRDPREVVTAGYVSKVNVVANHVATKE